MKYARTVAAMLLGIALLLLMAGPAQAAKVVDVDNMQFTPKTVRITAGHAVKWVFHETHTTTSNTGLWDSGVKSAGQTFRRVFSSAGTFRYHCTLHAGMTGKVVVRAPRLRTPHGYVLPVVP